MTTNNEMLESSINVPSILDAIGVILENIPEKTEEEVCIDILHLLRFVVKHRKYDTCITFIKLLYSGIYASIRDNEIFKKCMKQFCRWMYRRDNMLFSNPIFPIEFSLEYFNDEMLYGQLDFLTPLDAALYLQVDDPATDDIFVFMFMPNSEDNKNNPYYAVVNCPKGNALDAYNALMKCHDMYPFYRLMTVIRGLSFSYIPLMSKDNRFYFDALTGTACYELDINRLNPVICDIEKRDMTKLQQQHLHIEFVRNMFQRVVTEAIESFQKSQEIVFTANDPRLQISLIRYPTLAYLELQVAYVHRGEETTAAVYSLPFKDITDISFAVCTAISVLATSNVLEENGVDSIGIHPEYHKLIQAQIVNRPAFMCDLVSKESPYYHNVVYDPLLCVDLEVIDAIAVKTQL